MDALTLEPVTAENWREALELAVLPEQLPFVAGYAPIAAIGLAKAYVGAGGLRWEPLAVREGARLVGFLCLAWAPAGDCWLFHFFIDRHQQGRGLGRKALGAAVGLARSREPGAGRLLLRVHPYNEVARRLYESVGFLATGTVEDDEPVYELAIT